MHGGISPPPPHTHIPLSYRKLNFPDQEPVPPSPSLLAIINTGLAPEAAANGLRGVRLNRIGTWQARLTPLGLGTFPTAEAAAEAYDEAAHFIFGRWVLDWCPLLPS